MKPAGRYVAFALAIALPWTSTPAWVDPACATIPEQAEFSMTHDYEERRMKAEAAFQSVLCGPPAIRRRACCPPTDDDRVHWPAFKAWFKAMWPTDKATLRGARAR